MSPTMGVGSMTVGGRATSCTDPLTSASKVTPGSRMVVWRLSPQVRGGCCRSGVARAPNPFGSGHQTPATAGAQGHSHFPRNGRVSRLNSAGCAASANRWGEARWRHPAARPAVEAEGLRYRGSVDATLPTSSADRRRESSSRLRVSSRPTTRRAACSRSGSEGARCGAYIRGMTVARA